MRRRKLQKSLTCPEIDHPYAEELWQIEQILQAQDGLQESVTQDLLRGVEHPETGAPGMTGEQVLRALLVKKLYGFSYEGLAFHLRDSRTFSAFCGYGPLTELPSRSTLAENIGKVRAETWKALSQAVVAYAIEEGMEDGLKVRIDAMVTETNIHEPSDSHQLWDGVRVVTRLLKRAEERFGFEAWSDHTLRAKRRMWEIRHSGDADVRKRTYRDLLKVAGWTKSYAAPAVLFLEGRSYETAAEWRKAHRIAAKLRRFSGLLARVIDQTERRVLGGERVPAREKILSLFEPHTDVIIKEEREVAFGHKVFLNSGASGLILGCDVADGNPADSTRTIPLLERQAELYGQPPEQAALDGGFASKANVEEAHDLGVEDIAFHKKRGLEISDMVKSSWVYQRLRDFRAGIEGTISFLKRAFGLRCCTWKGAEGFRAYVHASVLAANLLTVARHQLA